MQRGAYGQLHLSTRRLLRVVDACRPLLCLLTALLSLAFTVLLYVHIPRFSEEGRSPVMKDQPMYVLPSALVAVHVCAAILGIMAYTRVVLPKQPGTACSGMVSLFAFVSVFLAPVVGWAALRLFPGRSINNMIRDPAHTVASGYTIPSLARTRPDIIGAASTGDDCPLAARAGSRSAARAVFSSVWARVAIAIAMMETTSESRHLFTHHALTLGNGVIVLCTIALAAPAASTTMPEHVRALGAAAVVAAVLYQVFVFAPVTFARPPATTLLFLLCFVHDIANVAGALSSFGACEGSRCVSLAGPGYAYDVSVPGLAVLCSTMTVIPFLAVSITVGFVVDNPEDRVLVVILAVGGWFAAALLALFPAVALAVPCLSLVATVIIGIGPDCPGAAAEQTLLHVFCDEVSAAFARAAALVGPDSPADSVTLPPLCESSVLCRGRRAVDVHVLRHRTSQHLGELSFKPAERQLDSLSESLDAVGATVPLREILADDLPQQFAVSMAQVAAVLTPHPSPNALPSNVHNSPMAYLVDHLAGAEVAASHERRGPLVTFMEESGMDPAPSAGGGPSSITTATDSCHTRRPQPPTLAHLMERLSEEEMMAPCQSERGDFTRTTETSNPVGLSSSVTVSPQPVARRDGDLDLATETFDDAVRGGWRWLLRFAWRRRSMAPLPGHAIPRVFAVMLRGGGSVGCAKRFGAVGTLASLLLSRPVLFVAPLLEPAFNTNVPTMAYVCIAVRVVCWVGLALIAPSVYRTVCRTAAFSVVDGPQDVACSVSDAMLAAARCIAAAYEPHLPTVLRGSVPHRVVSHVVIGSAVAPYLPPMELKDAPDERSGQL